MLINKPTYYYSIIRKKFSNSYFAEDERQAIIGIDCEYFDSNEYSYDSLKKIYNSFVKQKRLSPFAGLFGTFAYESIHFFEKIAKIEKEQFKFPQFVFANAKAYLHYSKTSKEFSFYGDEEKYFSFLNDEISEKFNDSDLFYDIKTDFEEEKLHYYEIIEKAKEYIKSGDIFQVVLSEQLKLTSNMDSLDFYEKLSKANPSPYMYHFPTKYGDVVGSSPEILAEILSNNIYIAPIAGTRPRGKDANEDSLLAQDLLNDPKECAEHRMLVDLARNDIGKFAEKGSVIVKNMMHVKHYQHVMHIVSEVFGQKRNDVSLFNIVSSVFPAGTLSGAPKIRAMEIIGELEEYKRNIYGGGIGFLHFNGNMQLAIVIRSAFFTNKNHLSENFSKEELPEENSDFFRKNEVSNVFIQAGAGIVYDSIKEKEYEEITHKRASVLNIFKNNCKEREE